MKIYKLDLDEGIIAYIAKNIKHARKLIWEDHKDGYLDGTDWIEMTYMVSPINKKINVDHLDYGEVDINTGLALGIYGFTQYYIGNCDKCNNKLNGDWAYHVNGKICCKTCKD